MNYTVAIVGRPNVGKSTLFNRLIGDRQAIVDDLSGVTRDRQYGVSYWNGRTFNVIDTGGFVARSEEVFEKAIRSQVLIAMEEASVILFVVDITTGITDLDEEVARMLHRSPKKVLLVANKADNAARVYESTEFYGLGFEQVYPISSISGSGTGELLDAMTAEMEEGAEVVREDVPRITIIGQPNVGKSSLLNALTGEDRNIVTNIAGTTRDAIDTHYKLYGKDLILVDTAGIRKKGKVHEDLEFYSVIRAIKAIDEGDVCVLVLDATVGIESQDLTILSQAISKKKGVVVAVNKWDLVENKTNNTTKELEDKIRSKTAPFQDVPILFISALEKQRIHRVLDKAIEVYENRKKKIPTSQLNEVMLDAVEKHHPPSTKGKFVKIKYVTQLPTPTPTFAFFAGNAKYIRQPYKQYLENRLREAFNFEGVPLILVFREK